jgi:hypothetical protein
MGKWTASDGEVTVVLELKANGRFVWTERTAADEETDVGTWRVDGESLRVVVEGEEEAMQVPFRLLKGDRLWLNVPEEGQYTLERAAASHDDKEPADQTQGPAGKKAEWKTVKGTAGGCHVRERLLYDGKVYWATLSPDGSRYAGTVSLGASAWAPIVDGRKGATFKDIDDLAFTPDGKQIVFHAKRDGKWFLVVGEKEHAPCDKIKGEQFSPDGKRLAYLAGYGRKWAVDVDGKRGQAYEEVEDVTFSADSAVLAYRAKSEGKWWVVAEGKRWGPYDDVQGLTVSPKGGGAAFIAKKKEDHFVVRDGKETKAAGIPQGLAFSPDGKRLAYAVWRPLEGMVVVDGKPQATYTNVTHPVFSSEGKHVAYGAVTAAGEAIVVVDGEMQAAHGKPSPYVRVENLVMSRDWKCAAMSAQHAKTRKYHVLVNGKPGPACESVWAIAVSPDGSRAAAYVKRGNDYFVLVDGKQHGPYTRTLSTKPRFSDDGKRLIYEAKRGGKEFLVVDGKAGAEGSPAVYLTFSPDGSHAACRIDTKSTVGDMTFHRIAVDTEAGPLYDSVCEPRFVGGEGKDKPAVMYVANRGKSLVLVRHPLPAPGTAPAGKP